MARLCRLKSFRPARRHSTATRTTVGFLDNAAQFEVHLLGSLRRRWIDQLVRVMVHFSAAFWANHFVFVL
jgi:hypothetical protein